MRVAVVSVSSGTHLRAYVGALVEAGHDVTLITNKAHVPGIGVPVIDIVPRTRWLYALPARVREWLRLRTLARTLRTGRFDVLNVQQVTSDGVQAARVFDGPVVLTFWGSDLLVPDLMPGWAREALPQVMRTAAMVHVCSEEMRDRALELGVGPERLASFQYGIDLGFFEFGGAPRASHDIVSTRLLAPLYRIDVAIKAFALVRRHFPDARFDVFGHGGEEQALRGLARAEGVADGVTFRGFAPAEELAATVARAAVWVSLPPSDGAPLSLLEAMAAGALPVVADIPALREWIAPGRGVLVPDVSPHRVAEGILEGFALAAEGSYARANRELVETNGDRARNLPRFVKMIEDAARSTRPGTTPEQ